MTRPLDLHPAAPLGPGRYHLDCYGRLHAAAKPGMAIVAIVTVRARPAEPSLAPDADAIRASFAAEAGQREMRMRAATRLAKAHPLPVTPRTEQPTRSLARRVKPTVVHVPKEELLSPDETDAAMAEFEAKLKAVRARRAKATPMISEPKVNAAAIAAAHRAKPLGRAPKKAPTRRALGPGECHRCGIRGAVGCDHFLPYLGDAQ